MAETPLTFFSYSREDSAFVLKVASELRAAGAEVWLDQLDIRPGEHWDTAVENALARAGRIVVVLSPTAVASQNVMDEVSFALDENRTVIPIIHRECKIPFRLRRLQYVDFTRNHDPALKELVEVLRGGAVREALPPAALEVEPPRELPAKSAEPLIHRIFLLGPRTGVFARITRVGFYLMLILTAFFVLGVFLDENNNFNLRAPTRDLGTNLGAFGLVIGLTAAAWYVAYRANSRRPSTASAAGQDRSAAAGQRG